MGRCYVERRTFSGRNSAAAANNVGKDNNRGGTDTLAPPSATRLRGTTTTMTTMATMIASPATIESTGAATIFMPHGAELPSPPPSPAVDLTVSLLLSCLGPSAKVLMQAPSNTTNAQTHESLSSVEDGGTMVPAALLSLAATSIAAAAAPPTMMATLTMTKSFV